MSPSALAGNGRYARGLRCRPDHTQPHLLGVWRGGDTPSAAMVFTLGDGQIGARPSIASGGSRLILSHRRTPGGSRRGPGETLSCGRRPWAVPPAVLEAWLALPSCSSAHVRWRGCCRRNLGGTPPRLGALLEVYAQVKGSARQRRVSVCKTVGLAYVGSNPTPATTCENGPWPGRARARGPPCCCPGVCHDVPL